MQACARRPLLFAFTVPAQALLPGCLPSESNLVALAAYGWAV